MPHVFTVAGAAPVDLDDLANELRVKIGGLPPDSPLLQARFLNQQIGVQAFLVVIRGNEEPHTHPDGDLIISVLEGGGYVQLTSGKLDAPTGSALVVPKGVCHAYYNLSESDSVLLATFSPIDSKGECPLVP